MNTHLLRKMSDDIVERLRDRACHSTESIMMSAVRQSLDWQAAEEIERLREAARETVLALCAEAEKTNDRDLAKMLWAFAEDLETAAL